MKLRERWIPGQARNDKYTDWDDRKELNLRHLRHSGLFSGYFAFFIRHSGLRAGIQIFLFSSLFLSLFSFPSQTSAATITRPSNGIGLIGYWTFDGKDMSPNVRDVSGLGNHGNLSGQTSTTTVLGKIGQALDFDGSNDAVTTSDFIGNLPELSISVWIKPTTGSFIYQKYSHIIGNILDVSTDAGFQLSFLSNIVIGGESVSFTAQESGGSVWTQKVADRGSIEDGRWHNIVATYRLSDNSVSIYLDGVSQSLTDSSQGTVSNYDSNNPVKISVPSIVGAYNYPLLGSLDDVRIYNRVLSATEVKGLYNASEAKLTSSKSPGTLSSGLVGHWTFDGADMIPNVRDKSGQGNHGNLSGQTSTTTDFGVIGQALRFDGVDDYVNAGSSVPFDSNNWTISIWAKATNIGGSYQRFLSYYGDGPTFWKANLLGSFSIVHSGTIDLDCAASLVNNEWTMITATRSGLTLRCYKDGVKTAEDLAFSSTFTSGSSVRIGNSAAYDEPFKGTLDDARIYNRALSADEIKQLYNMGGQKLNDSQNVKRGTLNDGLVGLWSFDGKDISGTTAYDRSGQGNNGTLTNGPVPTYGRIGQALKFDGVDDYIDVPDNTYSDVSVSAWINVNTVAVDNEITGGGGILDYFLTYPGSGFLSAYDGSEWRSGTTALIPNNWYHISLTFVGATKSLNLYVNGVNEYSSVGLGTVTNGQITQIGRNPSYKFNGSMDDFRIYNRALSASEVKQLYNMGR